VRKNLVNFKSAQGYTLFYIDEIYTQWPVFGSRRITAMLRRKGININRKAVQRHMQEMGIAGICPEPNLSKRRQKDQVYPYLLKGLAITRPNQVWGTDITYIRLKGGWLYLVAIKADSKAVCGDVECLVFLALAAPRVVPVSGGLSRLYVQRFR
jgi:hypothetical protein